MKPLNEKAAELLIKAGAALDLKDEAGRTALFYAIMHNNEYIFSRLLQAGGAKFNVSTELKYTLIDATYKYISEKREEYNPGKIDIAVRDAIRAVVARWIDVLGSAGKA